SATVRRHDGPREFTSRPSARRESDVHLSFAEAHRMGGRLRKAEGLPESPSAAAPSTRDRPTPCHGPSPPPTSGHANAPPAHAFPYWSRNVAATPARGLVLAASITGDPAGGQCAWMEEPLKPSGSRPGDGFVCQPGP